MDDTILAKQVGDNLAKYRNAAGLTQAQLADMVGVTPAFISRVERGQKSMKLSTLIAVAQSLQISCDALLLEHSTETQCTTLQHLLSGKPAEYIEGIEAIVRICVDKFDTKQEK